MKKVLLLIQGGIGGAEKMTINIGKFLKDNGYQVKFVVIGINDDVSQLVPKGTEIIRIMIPNYWDFLTLRLINLFHKLKPDFVFCSAAPINLRALLAAEICGIKIIVRNDNFLKNFKLRNKIAQRFTYSWAYKLIAQQEEMRQEMISVLHLPAEKVFALQNPLDTENIDKLASVTSPYNNVNQIKIVCVARFDYKKGQDVMIKAFCELHKKINNTKLYFIGKYNEDDSFYKSVKEIMDVNKLNDSVHFVGYDSNPYKWVKNADCFVLTSRIEGLPNALIEALYLGVPSVATKSIPIITRIIDEGKNGYTAEIEDYAGVAKGIEKALKLRNVNLGTYRPASEKKIVNLFK